VILCDQSCPNPVHNMQICLYVKKLKADQQRAKVAARWVGGSQPAPRGRANLLAAYASSCSSAVLKFQFENGTGINFKPVAALVAL
jgi:hypothetical protein